MDENFNNFENNEHKDETINTTTNTATNDVNRLSMDERGTIHTDRNGAAAVGVSARTFLVLGWISAALTAFISPYFAIAGIVFGVLANRRQRGSGNAVIVTNVVLALVNLLFGLFLIGAIRRMIIGY